MRPSSNFLSAADTATFDTVVLADCREESRPNPGPEENLPGLEENRSLLVALLRALSAWSV